MSTVVKVEPRRIEMEEVRSLWCTNRKCSLDGGWGYPGDDRVDECAELGNPWKRYLAGETICCERCHEPLEEVIQAVRNVVPAEITIHCGCGHTFTEAQMGYDLECPRCQQPYNSFGQELERDRRLWDGYDYDAP